MNKLVLLPIMALLLMGTSCNKDKREGPSMSVNGVKKTISLGFIKDAGFNATSTSRRYDLDFGDKQNLPTNYIMFRLNSTGTQKIEPGDYPFALSNNGGVFRNLFVGWDNTYDAVGVLTKGERLSENEMTNIVGTVKVTKEDGDYRFAVDLTFTYNSKNYSIKAHFWNKLNDGEITLF